MNISLLDGTSIDVTNIALFKMYDTVVYNHTYERYIDFYEVVAKNIDRITYIYIEVEDYIGKEIVSDMKEKHYLYKGVHHRIDGPSIYRIDKGYESYEEILYFEEISEYYIHGKKLSREEFLRSPSVIRHGRKKKIKKLCLI